MVVGGEGVGADEVWEAVKSGGGKEEVERILKRCVERRIEEEKEEEGGGEADEDETAPRRGRCMKGIEKVRL